MEKTTHYKGHRWTNYELKKLMKMWDNDYSLKEIALSLKSSTYAILKQVQKLREAGIPLKKKRSGNFNGNVVKPWTDGETEYLIRRRNEKATASEIGSELNRSPNAIDGMIKKLREEGVDVAMRGCGVRRLWDSEKLKVIALKLKN